MNVKTLIERLQEYPEDSDVQIVFQPNYPLMANLRGVVSSEELTDEETGDEEAERDTRGGGEPGIVYLAAGSAEEYAPGAVYRNLND